MRLAHYLHRPADLRHRPQRLRDPGRAGRARHPAGRAISGDRAADGPDHDDLSRRIRRDGLADGRDAARAGDQRRREHALYEQPVDRRRQAHDHGDLPDRHRPERRADADAEPRPGRLAAAARGRPAPGRAGPEIDAQHPARRPSHLARQLARRSLHLELRDAACEGRAGAPAGRGRRPALRRPRICHAHLARSGQGRGP